ncbi:cytochrome-c peroxidase [Synoicihabitans lomoniglobus]|uniref:Cytochrome c peroxidase n=1 Tax=Synoicihabitans lomoniglobus TaxID=2909285 RepID=A0AAF0CIG0_9BACT|nr:hypothetical protein [Opitutaceae bacterium LMO-M01]WED65357.1 cytochrome c peroxidase [Opitutaceae bacterium LMO-M01]
MTLRLPSLLLLAATSSFIASAETVPVLPEIPHDYAGLVLPGHFLTNEFPDDSPFQNAVIDNDNTPASNPTTNDGATLGRVLFYDRKLSANGTVSCASCHEQEHAFSDSRRLSLGFDGGTTRRHSMGLTNARFYDPGKFFWNERADTLEDQVLMPFQDEVEMGLTLEQLVALVAGEDYYPELFQNAFGSPDIDAPRIARALAQFVRSIVSVNSRYDQGRATVSNPLQPFPNFTNQENQGKAVFMNAGNRPVSCIDCHTTEAFISPARGTSHASATSAATNNGLDRVSTDDLGIAEATGNVDDTGKFKVPSLRNIAVTAPFMHDGRFDTLQQVMNFYDNGIQNHAQLSDVLVGPNGQARRINLNNNDRNAIIAFLNTLTDEALLTDEKFSDPFVEVPDVIDEDPSPAIEDPVSTTAHLSNLSARARVGSGIDALVAGFVVTGTAPKTLLIRGIGPELATFGATDVVAAPTLRLFSGETEIAFNTSWTTAPNATAIADVSATVGAFALPSTGADSAVLTTVEPGAYTAHLIDPDGAPSTGLIEIYAADTNAATELTNISARATLSPGGEIIIPGFVVTGEGPKTFLIRAIGPSLSEFGITDALADPQLTIYADTTLITTNDDWALSGTAATTEATSAAVGAFDLPVNSKDAAVTVTLQPGPYTVHVGSTDTTGGTLLVEIYAIPIP